jgi:hypothetical protein
VNSFVISCDLPTNGRSHLSDPPRHTQFNLVSIPCLSWLKAVYTGSVTRTRQTGFGQAMLLVRHLSTTTTALVVFLSH